MPKINIVNLTNIYKGKKGDKIIALDKVNLLIADKMYNTLLGPSGCGKTTLLRCIAGLIKPTSGLIKFDNKDVTALTTQERDIGFVFQDFAAFPHLDVWHNVSYGPVVKGWSQHKIIEETEKNLKLVGLSERANALPNELSGGMRQRLGLARALATRSKLLLLDEPLSALDAKIGTYLRYELRRIVTEHQLTAIHVTHNQDEAMTISDNIILMKKGRVVQTGAPEELYSQPQSIFAANFMGKCSFLEINKLTPHSYEFQGKKFTVKKKITVKNPVLGIRPEKVRLSLKPDRKLITGKIEVINFLGHLFEYRIAVEGTTIKAYKRVKEEQIKKHYKVGDQVSLWFNPDEVFMFEMPKDLAKELSVE